MQVSLATTEGLGRKLTVVIPAAEVDAEYKQRLGEVAKTAKVDGFRPGKVPARVIEERYGPSVRHEIIDKLLRKTLNDAMQQEKVSPAGMPTIDSLKAEPGQDLEYEANFEVYPEIALKDLSGVDVEKIESEITDKDIDAVLEKLRQQHADWESVERAASNDDQVIVDFEGFVDGEAFEGGKAENVPLILGSKTMIPGFEEGLVGAKPGDDIELKVTFPEKYHAEALAGKEAIFKTKVHKVNQAKLPELDDKFAEKFAVKEGGLAALKADMKKHMERELNNTIKLRNKEAVFDKLVAQNEVTLPKALVEEEMKNLHNMAHKQQGQEHADHELSAEEKERLQEPAEHRVKLALLLNEVIKEKKLAPDNDKVKSLVEEMASGYENPAEFINWYYSDRKRLAQVEAMALEDQVVETLLNDAKVTAKQMSYDEVIKHQ